MISNPAGRQMRAHIRRIVGSFLLNTARRKPATSSFNVTSRSLWNSTHPGSAISQLCSTSRKANHRMVTRRFATGGVFAFGISPSSSISEVAVTTCSTAIEKSIYGGSSARAQNQSSQFVRNSLRRTIHTSSKRRSNGSKKNESSRAEDGVTRNTKINPAQKKAEGPPSKQSGKGSAVRAGVVSESSKMLYERFQNINHLHRPTKDELLAAATGFWSRLKIRFKWFSIRSLRPFNADDISAFFSWVLLGHVIWIIVGTTTFFSLGILALNTVFAQETLARWIGNYLTQSSGLRVVFESAIVPNWKDGVISFKNVFVTRRPGLGRSKVKKGSSATAAAAAAAAAAKNEGQEDTDSTLGVNDEEEEEDTNYTQFDLTLGTVNVTLSFAKWFNGKGLLRNVEVQGVRGVVDRTSVHYNGLPVDPRSYRHEHNPGDFELESFKMEDLLVTVHQPNGFRPFSVSIFACDLPQLRKQWLFYDFLSANTVSGSFDESLFTIHPRQTHGYTGTQLNNGVETYGVANPWKKHSRLRIDALNIDHLNRGVHGPLSWINEGNVDIVADVMFPAENDESIGKVVSDFYERMEATVTQSPYLHPHTTSDSNALNNDTTKGNDSISSPIETSESKDEDKRFLIMDLRIHLNDVRAAVPIFTRDLSYVNNALIRPIVAYINSRNTFIPINCRLIKRVTDFDGSWTMFDSGLMEDLSAETYDAFARSVVDDQARMRRFKKVGLWSLQLAIQALFMGMAGNVA